MYYAQITSNDIENDDDDAGRQATMMASSGVGTRGNASGSLVFGRPTTRRWEEIWEGGGAGTNKVDDDELLMMTSNDKGSRKTEIISVSVYG